MKERLVLIKELFGQLVTITSERLGEDYLLTVTGGHGQHIGSVSTALISERLGQPGLTTTVSTYVYPGHKDDLIGNRFAEAVSKCVQQKVVVVCGVHFDDLKKSEIDTVIECFETFLDEFIGLMKESICDLEC